LVLLFRGKTQTEGVGECGADENIEGLRDRKAGKII
jgi:hypothetical protein